MICRQLEAVVVLFVVIPFCLLEIAAFEGSSKYYNVELSRTNGKTVDQRSLKMGMMSKKNSKGMLDDELDLETNDDVASNSTLAPTLSLAPSLVSMSSKKKKKKSKKVPKSEKSKKKKKKKSKKSKKSSESPSSSTSPVAPPGTNATTVAPVAPISLPSNDTSVSTAPSVQSKAKKSKNGKGGKGKGSASKQFRSRGGQPSISPAPTFSLHSSSSLSISPAPTVSLYPSTPLTRSATVETAAPTTKTQHLPTLSVVRPTPTSSPTGADVDYLTVSASPEPTVVLEQVVVSPFQVTYDIVAMTALSGQHIDEVVDVTFLYINTYLTNSFSSNKQVMYDSLVGSRTAHSTDFTEIQCMATAQFVNPSDETMLIPTTSDIDSLLQVAFNPPIVETLLIMLQNLPANNPYSKVSQVLYTQIALQNSIPSGDQQPSSSDGKGTATTAGVTGAVLVACLVTGLVALYRHGMLDKIRLTIDKTKYRKAPEKEIHTTKQDTAQEDHNVEDDGVSDCTSSIGSCPPSSSCSSSIVDEDGYRSHIIEDDVEIKFLYPAGGEMNNNDPVVTDPLFPQSPLTSHSEDGRKKRHYI
jgi:hypothetical protein